MWIHINGGDDGLTKFLLDAKSFMLDDGLLLIEPQPGKCYRSAAKRCRKLGLAVPLYLNQIDKANVNITLTRIMQDNLSMSYECFLGTEDWGRPMRLFYNNTNFHNMMGKTYPSPLEKPLIIQNSSNQIKKRQKVETNEETCN